MHALIGKTNSTLFPELTENLNTSLPDTLTENENHENGSAEGCLCRLQGTSLPMQQLYRVIRKVAPTQVSVLLIGESGSGKELVADAIHQLSERRHYAFLMINCGAISAEIMESELFGHEKGAFTGANALHCGFFERAHQGTLFLDEITEMPVHLQVKLLRVLESGRFYRVGGEREIAVDLRIIAATNRDPLAAVHEEKLREDLFYRLCQFPINVPPLRQRESDIPLLTHYFVEKANQSYNEHKTIATEAMEKLMSYDWPGNVRELKNCIDRAHILADKLIRPADIEFGRLTLAHMPYANIDVQEKDLVKVPVGSSIEEANRTLIMATLERTRGNKQKTAEILGISLKTLYSRLKEYQHE